MPPSFDRGYITLLLWGKCGWNGVNQITHVCVFMTCTVWHLKYERTLQRLICVCQPKSLHSGPTEKMSFIVSNFVSKWMWWVKKFRKKNLFHEWHIIITTLDMYIWRVIYNFKFQNFCIYFTCNPPLFQKKKGFDLDW